MAVECVFCWSQLQLRLDDTICYYRSYLANEKLKEEVHLQYQIYNSIKHDKADNLEKADLETEINMLGTLFILNSSI